MQRKKGRPKGRGKSGEGLERILNAFAELILEKDWSFDVTVKDIAERAGMTMANLYAIARKLREQQIMRNIVEACLQKGYLIYENGVYKLGEKASES